VLCFFAVAVGAALTLRRGLGLIGVGEHGRADGCGAGLRLG
jgi:hypothetical protein